MNKKFYNKIKHKIIINQNKTKINDDFSISVVKEIKFCVLIDYSILFGNKTLLNIFIAYIFAK